MLHINTTFAQTDSPSSIATPSRQAQHALDICPPGVSSAHVAGVRQELAAGMWGHR